MDVKLVSYSYVHFSFAMIESIRDERLSSSDFDLKFLGRQSVLIEEYYSMLMGYLPNESLTVIHLQKLSRPLNIPEDQVRST